MPRRVASAMAARLAAGSCQRLSSSVPSMSNAINRTAIPQLYRELGGALAQDGAVFIGCSFFWWMGYTPGILYEYQNKGVVKFAFRKCMKRKGRFSLGWGRGEFQNGNGSEGGGKDWFGENGGKLSQGMLA